MKLDNTGAGARPRALIPALLALTVLGLTACADLSGISPKAQLLDAASLGLPITSTADFKTDAQWWRDFDDAQLSRLIEQALTANPSLKVVQARLARAQAGVDNTTAAAKPQLSVNADATQQLYSANGMVPAPLGGSVSSSGTAQLNGAWELDFFGKNRAALDAALGTVDAAQADAQAARILLATQVARSYFQLVRLNEHLGVAQQQLVQRRQLLKLVQDRVNAGMDTRLELLQAQGALPEAQLQMETLQEQLALAKNALQALIYKENTPLDLVLPSQSLTKNIATATHLPSDLLGGRADIAAARWRVEAANRTVDHATSQFYPNINLMAFAGFSSIGLNHLVSAGSQQWGVGPALHLPIFDAGRLRANLSGKTADLDAAIESYNVTVIEAVHDVVDQLTSRQAIGRQQTEQQAAQSYAENAHAIAVQRYEAGLGNYLQVLTAEAAVLHQRRQRVDLIARAIDTQLLLIRAVGGGYRAEPPTHTTQP